MSVPPAPSASHLDKSKRAQVEDIFKDDHLANNECENVYTNPKHEHHICNIYWPKNLSDAKPLENKCKPTVQVDLEVVSIVKTHPTHEGKTADINEFFGTVWTDQKKTERWRSTENVRYAHKSAYSLFHSHTHASFFLNRKWCVLVNEPTSAYRDKFCCMWFVMKLEICNLNYSTR